MRRRTLRLCTARQPPSQPHQPVQAAARTVVGSRPNIQRWRATSMPAGSSSPNAAIMSAPWMTTPEPPRRSPITGASCTLSRDTSPSVRSAAAASPPSTLKLMPRPFVVAAAAAAAAAAGGRSLGVGIGGPGEGAHTCGVQARRQTGGVQACCHSGCSRRRGRASGLKTEGVKQGEASRVQTSETHTLTWRRSRRSRRRCKRRRCAPSPGGSCLWDPRRSSP